MKATRSEATLGDLQIAALTAAEALRNSGRPLPIAGHRQERRQAERRGVLGGTQLVEEMVTVPVTLPGWLLGTRVAVVDTGAALINDELLLTPSGHLATVRIDGAKPQETRVISTRALYAVRVLQSSYSTPDWQSTGNGSDRAARYTRTMTAGAAVQELLCRLRALTD